MATPIDLLDPPTVMSYAGLVDASTVDDRVDDVAGWCGASAVLAARLGYAPGLQRAEPTVAQRAAPMRRGTQWRRAARNRRDRAHV